MSWLSVLVVLIGAVPAHSAASGADDRLARMRDAVAASRVYVEESAAFGEARTWQARLETKLGEADPQTPIYLLLWADFNGWAPQVPQAHSDEAVAFVQDLGIERGVVILPDGSDGVWALTVGLPPSQRGRWKAFTRGASRIAELGRSQMMAVSMAGQVWGALQLDQDTKSSDVLVELAQVDGGTISRKISYYPGAESTPSSFVDRRSHAVALAILCATLVGLALLSRREPTAARPPRRARRVLAPDPWVRELTDVAVERHVTKLAERIARSLEDGTARPGQPAYEYAQACLDAAKMYVDEPSERDRVGCYVLAEDGLAAIGKSGDRRRCYFHPRHQYSTTVSRLGVELPVCYSCAMALRGGREPAALTLMNDDGELEAFYEVDDVWSETGYGALDPGLPHRAMSARTERR